MQVIILQKNTGNAPLLIYLFDFNAVPLGNRSFQPSRLFMPILAI
ncbi:MAG: hypothetical protein R6U28_12210 [Cyclonatronaceae bacterium]